MNITPDHHRAFGNTGLRVPPIMFGTRALANLPRVIPEQTKLELCGEWFKHVAAPVLIETSTHYGNGMALEMLGRATRSLEIAPDELVMCLRLNCREEQVTPDAVVASLRDACGLLGSRHKPQLLALDSPDAYLAAAPSASERDRRFNDLVAVCRMLDELKTQQQMAGFGVAATDWRAVSELDSAAQLDWVMLIGSFTILRHPPELLEFMTSLAARNIPIVASGLFHCDFLVGGNRFDGIPLNPDDPANRSLFAWRKSFVALCHGHGITPARACIEFALSAPGIAAVAINTSHRDRIAENVASAITPVPSVFWSSMKDERLLAEDYPYL